MDTLKKVIWTLYNLGAGILIAACALLGSVKELFRGQYTFVNPSTKFHARTFQRLFGFSMNPSQARWIKDMIKTNQTDWKQIAFYNTKKPVNFDTSVATDYATFPDVDVVEVPLASAAWH